MLLVQGLRISGLLPMQGLANGKNTPIKLYAAHPVHSPIQVTFIFQEVVHRLPPHLWNGISVMLRYSM